MQTPWMSLVEALTNIVVGFALALTTQLLLFPVLALKVAIGDHLLITSVFTVVSLVRAFVLRRVFNRLSTRAGA